MYAKTIQDIIYEKLQREIRIERVIEQEQDRYISNLEIPSGIALNPAFRENLFVILVALATKTPTIVVGRPGSSKTLAMATVQANLSSASKNKKLTQMRFADFFVVSFQCSKLTTAELIQRRWNFAVSFLERLNQLPNEVARAPNRRESVAPSPKNVVLALDEVGLAEQSKFRPLKVLHQLLEDEKREIAFIGLRCFENEPIGLHQVVQPNKEQLEQTATKIISPSENKEIHPELSGKIPKIAAFYDAVMTDHTDSPFKFDFFGYRDFYALSSYLKFCLDTRKVFNKELVIEAVMRNFGGLTKAQTESFLFPKISNYLLENSEKLDLTEIWKRFSPLHLIRDNIQQTRSEERPPTFEMRNIMLITESPFMWKILFDSGIASLDFTEVIFGSRFAGDADSSLYLYRTIEKVRNIMSTGRLCILLKLEKLYESLYDVLNQRYQAVDGQKYCRICLGGESVRCRIAKNFRCVVVVSSQEAHHNE
ncbi:hypothetical protein RFI_14843, partial [Reticulomyxa filosa]